VSQESLITFGGFSTQASAAFNIKEVPIFVVMGCAGGLFGALFNELNKHLTMWRQRNVKGFGFFTVTDGDVVRPHGVFRFIEALVVISTVTAAAFWMPYLISDCTSTQAAINKTCIMAGYVEPVGLNKGQLSQLTLDTCTSDGGAWNNIEDTPVQFNCVDGGTTGSATGGSPDHYSPAATLFFGKADGAIKHLFHNQLKMEYTTLLVFFCIYFCLACWTYGIGVPSGLFVPSLLTGAAFGRICGELVREYLDPDVYPGIYALVGAAAFLAGMARITISLTVILMECSRSVQNGLPIMVTVMFAKWVGDIFNVGLYDIHIELDHVPFLEPFPEEEHGLLMVRDVMSKDCETHKLRVLPEICLLKDLIEILRSCDHSCFPVVESKTSMKFKGLIRRDYLCGTLVQGGQGVLQRSDDPSSPGYMPDIEMLELEKLMRLFPKFPSIDDATKHWYDEQQHGTLFLRLTNYYNPEPFYMGPEASLSKCYRLLRGLGLRCIPIIDSNHAVCGVVTRQDLLHQSVHIGLENALSSESFRKARSDSDCAEVPAMRAALPSDNSPRKQRFT